METLETLKRTVAVTTELHAVVKTMKVLAGVNIRQCERAVSSITAYNQTIEIGLQVALRELPEQLLPPRRAASRRMGAIVFGSDQGMCGALNDQVAAYASRALRRLALRRARQTIVALGTRAASALEAKGQKPDRVFRVPATVAGIPDIVHDLLETVEEWHLRRGIDLVLLFFCQPLSGRQYRPRGLRLLPVDPEWIHRLKVKPWPSRVIPMFTLPQEDLFRALIREYLFSSLVRAAADSLASENASRLGSMQAAERNIDDRLHELKGELSECRQEMISSELLDISAGFEALRDAVAGQPARTQEGWIQRKGGSTSNRG